MKHFLIVPTRHAWLSALC